MIGLRFINPWWLLLLPPLLFLVWRTSRRSLSGLSPRRARTAAWLRTALIVCLVGAMAQPQAIGRLKELTVLYVVDVSKSITADGVKKALDWARKSQKNMGADDRAGIIVFGKDARIEFAPSQGKLPDSFHARVDGTASDLSAALRLAVASFPERTSRHIVLLSDGNETAGDALDQARIARAGGIRVDTVPLGAQKRDEAWVESLEIPSRLKKGEPFDVRVVTGSTAAQQATVRLYRNGEPIGSREVSLPAGRSVFMIPQTAEDEGSSHYRVELDPKVDSSVENNKGYAYAMVEGRPRVIMVTTNQQADSPLIQSLRGVGIDLDVMPPALVPSTVAEMTNVDGLILSDVPATSFSVDQMFTIRAAVRQVGSGLAMIGGEDSFGAGGYLKTPVEEALPVRMSIRKTEYMPSLTLMIVIDKSGSMGAMERGVEKIRLAAEAAVACLDAIQPDDQLGVIACDSDPKLVSPITRASERDKITENIRSIRAGGGGIMVYSSLVRAHEELKAANTRIRHIILLADGSDAEEQLDSVQLAAQMAQEKITISTVAIGGGPDVPFLQQVARTGKGGFYLTESAHDLPKIFTKDALLASRSLLVDERFTPRVDSGAEPLAGVTVEGVPPLLGYVATTAKARSQQAMMTHRGDPLLATWQYGVGRALAFTSDARARWAAHWMSWDGYPSLWAQNVRWIMRRSRPADWQAALTISSGKAVVSANAVDEKGNPIGGLNLQARMALPGGQLVEKTLEQVGPGRYETEIPASAAGDYVVNVVERGGSEGGQDLAAASLAYPEEYRLEETNAPLLRRLSQTSGGRFDPDPASLYGDVPRTQRSYTDLWRLLIYAALVLLPVDVAVRRLVLTREDVAEVAERVRARIPGRRRRVPAARPATSSALLRSKQARSSQPGEATEQPAVQPVAQAGAPDARPQAPAASDFSPAQTPQAPPPEPAAEGTSAREKLLATKRKRSQQ